MKRPLRRAVRSHECAGPDDGTEEGSGQAFKAHGFGGGPRFEPPIATAPILALAKILRPRILISSNIVNAPSPDELGAVLRHERAHGTSRDNAKRLALLLVPSLLPLVNGFGALERNWVKFNEWAADDRAVGGNPLRSVSLAAALVHVSRMGMAAPALVSSFADGRDLPARVDRLLQTQPPCELPERRTVQAVVGAALAAGFLAATLQPATLASVHMLLERLIH